MTTADTLSHNHNVPEWLLASSVQQIEVGGNQPFALDDPQRAWVMCSGTVDIFAVWLVDGQPQGPRTHVCRLQAGQILFGIDPQQLAQPIGLLARCIYGTRLVQLDMDLLHQLAPTQQLADLLDEWVTALSAGLVTEISPREHEVLSAGQDLELREQSAATPNKGLVWTRLLVGQASFLGRSDQLLDDQSSWLPLTPSTWLCSLIPSQVHICTTNDLLKDGAYWSSLMAFHQRALSCIASNKADREATEQQRLEQQAQADQLLVEQTLTQLGTFLEAPPAFSHTAVDSLDPLLAACRLIGQVQGIEIQPPIAHHLAIGQSDPLQAIARASRVRTRQIAFYNRWWLADHGPLLGFTGEDRRPVALLPAGPRRYQLLDPATQQTTPMTETLAASLAPIAYTFYRPFPERALKALDMLRFGFHGHLQDITIVALMGLATGLLGIAIPLATGLLFDTIIPGAERGQLFQFSLILLVSIVAGSLFQITHNIAVLRLEGHVDAALQAAIWDRLLRLPIPFFRRYSAGDLAERAMGISQIRKTLSETIVVTILAILFSLFNIGLLFYFNVTLALAALGLVGFSIGTMCGVGYLQFRYQRALVEQQGRIAGTVLQLIGGIAKFRVAGAEDRAFTVWARAFRAQRQLAFKARRLGNTLTLFNATYPLLATALLFALVGWKGNQPNHISTGAFLAFLAAFNQILMAGISFSLGLRAFLSSLPLYERLQPIMQASPEVGRAKADPGELRGAIEISHMSFRYKDDERLILNDLSLRINPGEFIALVGPSGCGKSTLLRLLLGFETPHTGVIYYDGQDLARLDAEAVRRQMGVVLQNSKLIAGDIYTNIVGTSALSIEEAWEAARMVGLAEDIEQMPMGMHTMISEGGSNLSGGQRQRILIARAIARKPRILLFDEATSALDNRTQALVGRSLERLHATRIVIAHRLSTIINADRIFVVHEGRIVQQGNYAELSEQGGMFAEFAKRQLL